MQWRGFTVGAKGVGGSDGSRSATEDDKGPKIISILEILCEKIYDKERRRFGEPVVSGVALGVLGDAARADKLDLIGLDNDLRNTNKMRITQKHEQDQYHTCNAITKHT